MGVFTYENEVATAIPPARMFKAFVLDSQNLMPKAVPHAIKKVEVEGDGGAGTLKKICFAEGMQFKSVTQKVESVDEENLTYSYSVIEGDALMDTVEKIAYSAKLVASPDGGSIFKTTATYYPKGDSEITEDKIKTGKEKALVVFKAVEAYLLAHPDEYN